MKTVLGRPSLLELFQRFKRHVAERWWWQPGDLASIPSSLCVQTQSLWFVPPTHNLICLIASSLFHSCLYSVALLSHSFAWLRVLSFTHFIPILISLHSQLLPSSSPWFSSKLSLFSTLASCQPSCHSFVLIPFPHLLTVPISLVHSKFFSLPCHFLFSFSA